MRLVSNKLASTYENQTIIQALCTFHSYTNNPKLGRRKLNSKGPPLIGRL